MHNEIQIGTLISRSGGLAGDSDSRPPAFKAVGISLSVASGVFIGTSFVLKKVGLLKANAKYNEEAGEGYGYLKNAYWWGGMILMIVGEICNFVAYAFVDAILVTPLGALSVVITTVLSAIFLKERLSFVGKVGCLNCLIGSVVIALNAPSQSSVSDIQGMKHFVLSPGFLTFTGVIIAVCMFLALWAGPRYGKKSMFVYLTICSLIGGLSVVATQGLGAAIIAQISGKSQFKEWFLYILLVFVIVTLVTEIIYLNKALNIYNAALVTPTYYVIFTSATIITSAVLFQGFKGTPISITTIVMGFLQICTGVVLLQLSKSAKEVPDAAVLKGDLDQVREVAEQQQPETEPKADSIRGASSILRQISVSRRKMEEEEFKRYHMEQKLDELPLRENEIVEWDGLRRRKTVLSSGLVASSSHLRKLHPPLGMSSFPDDMEEDLSTKHSSGETGSSFLGKQASGNFYQHVNPTDQFQGFNDNDAMPKPPMHTQGTLRTPFQYNKNTGSSRSETKEFVIHEEEVESSHTSSPPTPPPHKFYRVFSFDNFFHRGSQPQTSASANGRKPSPGNRISNLSPFSPQNSVFQRQALKNVTEEESLGLVERNNSREMDTQGRSPSP